MKRKMEWRVIGQSVRGAAHNRLGLPNQDAIHWLPASGVGPPIILGVSDGHGSPKSFRSDIGSRLAVERSAWMVQDLIDGQPDPTNLSAIKRTAEDYLPREIVRSWEQVVNNHLDENPFTDEELTTLSRQQGDGARKQVEDNPLLAYGATILIVLVTENFIIYLQLGDGDILVVDEDGIVSRPMPKDDRLFANETTSLCRSEAWRDVRFRFQALYGKQPAMILLSTDGYANSFRSDEAFMRVGTDMLGMLRKNGIDPIKKNLKLWLQETTKAGSGDDITLGLVYRSDMVGAELSPAISTETHPEAEVHIDDTADKEMTLPDHHHEHDIRRATDDNDRRSKLKRMKQDGPRELTKKLPDLLN